MTTRVPQARPAPFPHPDPEQDYGMTSNDDLTRIVAGQVLDQVRSSIAADEDQLRGLQADADRIREQIADRQAALGLTERRAEACGIAIRIKHQVVALMAGTADVPDPATVTRIDGLGMVIGAQKLAPPPDSPIEVLHRYQALMREVYENAFEETKAAGHAIRAAQGTVQTGELPEEFQPQPDPLTAPALEVPGARAAAAEGQAELAPALPWAEHIGHRVEVLTSDLERTRGDLVRSDAGGLVLAVPGEGEQTIPRELVRHVARAEGSGAYPVQPAVQPTPQKPTPQFLERLRDGLERLPSRCGDCHAKLPGEHVPGCVQTRRGPAVLQLAEQRPADTRPDTGDGQDHPADSGVSPAPVTADAPHGEVA
ncbi:hypothetical protein [Actinomadura opuntiae]|uniref:hypothetical protein n=1 Tax=Actinomadura sp. OS1-43 TaxID=604315 RepID=UPI00255A8A83|nr:hypothetical protein [Actinomadura sp. OS1-43]MDL4812732.1 hypothetical protein [Actinomadura sp. OS1-43]